MQPTQKIRLRKWAARVAALVLFGLIGLALDAPGFSLVSVGLGVAIGAPVLAFIFKPWRTD